MVCRTFQNSFTPDMTTKVYSSIVSHSVNELNSEQLYFLRSANQWWFTVAVTQMDLMTFYQSFDTYNIPYKTLRQVFVTTGEDDKYNIW